MKLVDTHSHLKDYIFCKEIEEILTRARSAGLVNIITCSTEPSEWTLYQDLCNENPDISWQIGIHPSDIRANDEQAVNAMGAFFASGTPPVAIGEIGLDFYRLPENLEEAEKTKARQTEIFKKQLVLAAQWNAKICVHARNAIRESIDVIAECGVNFSNVVYHCYSGNVDEIKLLNELGARASFTGIISYKGADEMRTAMLEQGIGRLMIETDCPYLAPTPFRGKRNEPSLLPYTAKSAAEAFGVSADYIADATTQNAKEFFGLP